MAVQSIDSNVWYTIQNAATDYYLGFTGAGDDDMSAYLLNSPVNWQFLDPSVAGGGPASGLWLLRPSGYNLQCLDVSSGSPTISVCSSSTILWRSEDETFSDGNSAWSLFNSSASGYLAAQSPSSQSLDLLSNVPDTENDVLLEFALSSVSQINDPAWSTLPYSAIDSDSSTTTTTTTTTAETVSTPMATSEGSTTITSTMSAHTAASSTAPSQTSSTNFSFSIVDKSIAELGPPASLFLPPDTNIGCENCTASGTASLSAGGYDPTSDDKVRAIADFLSQGYINIDLPNLNANISIDFELLPGFSIADVFIPLYGASLGSLSITDWLTIDLAIEYGIPLSLTLDTPVTFTGGFVLAVSDASLYLDFGTFSNSSATGLNSSSLQPLPFHVSAPNLEFTALTGLSLRIIANATANADVVEANGGITFDLGMPSMNFTTQVVSNVDDNCNPSNSGTVHPHAINLLLDLQAQASAEGEISISVKSEDDLDKTFSGGDFQFQVFDIYHGDKCLYDNALKAKFLNGGNKVIHEIGSHKIFYALLFIILWTDFA